MFSALTNRCVSAGALACLLLFASGAQAQTTPAPTTPTTPADPAAPKRGNVIRFVAHIDAAQSEAVNSTAIGTRNGTGTGFVTFDLVTGNLTVDSSFQGLIGEDITLGDPAVNPDGTTPAPGTINGNSLPGGGLFLFHFHVGARGQNGPIPVDIIGRAGPLPGVVTDPAPIQRQTAGRVMGTFNVNDLAASTTIPGSNPPIAKPAGILINRVPLDGREDDIRDVFCVRCGFIEGLLSGNSYLNIHTFNNPFGEIRGQLVAEGCDTLLNVNTLDALRNAVDVLRASEDTRRAALGLATRLAIVQKALDDNKPALARQLLTSFAGAAIDRSPLGRLPIDAANDLVCGATNVLISIPLPVPAP